MKKLLLWLLSVIWTSCASAQPTIEKYYQSAGSYQFNLIELASHHFFVGMGGAVLVDPQGNVIHNNYFFGDSIYSLQSVRNYSDNEFYFVAGYHKDSCTVIDPFTIPYTHPAIGKMDSLGNLLSLHYYELNAGACWNLPNDLEVANDKSVITWGNGGSGIATTFFSLKADSNGALVWAKHFSNKGGFQFIRELPGGDLLAGINMDTAGAVVARLNATGDFIWCKSYIRPKGMVHDCLIESDSSFIITGFTDSIHGGVFYPPPPPFHPKLFMMKLNGAGDVQWCRGYDSEYNWNVVRGSRIVKALDNDYIVLANVRTQNSAQPFLMKTDQNGDTLWTRSVGRSGYIYETTDLLACSDGGFLYDGDTYGDFSPWTGASYLFKTDSVGHLPCYERWHAVQVSELFPTDSSFTLTSVDGAVALPAFASDTIFGSILVYDGCTFATGMNPMQNRSFSVHPNPNTGRFTMEFKDPLATESYYSVYDTMGRLLYQRPLPKGAMVEEIDLSRFGKGTYVVKVTDKEGVCYERVVVE